jgi:hypothetical protein
MKISIEAYSNIPVQTQFIHQMTAYQVFQRFVPNEHIKLEIESLFLITTTMALVSSKSEFMHMKSDHL